MHMNIVITFDIVLTPSLRQVSREHSEPEKHVFLLFIPQSRETALRAEPCRFFFSAARELSSAATWPSTRLKKFLLHIWKRQVVKIKWCEKNFLNPKFFGEVTRFDVTIYL